METRTLKIRDADPALFEWRDSRPNTGTLKRFRHGIENTDWDEELLKGMKWVDGFACVLAAAAFLYVVCVGILILH